MNHNAMRNKVNRYLPTITHLSTLNPPIPFTLNEVGISLSVPNNPTYPLAHSFGATLWQSDFMLYCMSLNIQRINLQSGLGFQFSLWQPEVPGVQEAEVYPNLYAHFFAAEMIGAGGQTRVVNVDLGRPKLAVYAAYDGAKLARVALLNLRFYDGADARATKRGRVTFAVSAPDGCAGACVKRLASGLGATALRSGDVTWAGESWNAVDGGVPALVGVRSERVAVDGEGFVGVEVRDCEAVMVVFEGVVEEGA